MSKCMLISILKFSNVKLVFDEFYCLLTGAYQEQWQADSVG